MDKKWIRNARIMQLVTVVAQNERSTVGQIAKAMNCTKSYAWMLLQDAVGEGRVFRIMSVSCDHKEVIKYVTEYTFVTEEVTIDQDHLLTPGQKKMQWSHINQGWDSQDWYNCRPRPSDTAIQMEIPF